VDLRATTALKKQKYFEFSPTISDHSDHTHTTSTIPSTNKMPLQIKIAQNIIPKTQISFANASFVHTLALYRIKNNYL